MKRRGFTLSALREGLLTPRRHPTEGFLAGSAGRPCGRIERRGRETFAERISTPAFTLIELLVVIGIVGLLAAMLMPALRKARESARTTKCAGNLRQLGLAMQMYLDEQGRYFPFSEIVPNGRLWYFGLEQPFNPGGAPGTRKLDLTKAKLYPYFQTVHGIEVCPSYDYRSPKWRQKFETVSYGYGYNEALKGKSTSDIARPAEIVCFADAAQINTFQAPASASNPMLEEFNYVNPTERTTHFRHNGRANVLFCDGHVVSMPLAPGTLDSRMPDANVGRLNANTSDTSLFW
jgi:prepilin-type processing-associated H-X9-DG protein/prepilin-type N-terminal cleavage/methylation domain-containing protein